MALVLSATSPVAATTYALAPGQSVVGGPGTYLTRAGVTLLDVQRMFDLGYTQLVAANRGVDPWRPGTGRKIELPGRYLLPDVPRRGIVINLAEQRLYYFPPSGETVESYPIGVGVVGRQTRLGVTKVVGKTANPIWYPPPSIRAEEPDLPASVPPGSDNPLGAFALRLAWPSYLIHGTNKPDGVGRNVSHGCLHLYPEDIERLFREIPIGTPVRVVNDEFATAWIDQRLYVAVYRTVAQADDLAVTGSFKPAVPRGLHAAIAKAVGERQDTVDWQAVRRAGLERTGIPVAVSAALPSDAVLTR